MKRETTQTLTDTESDREELGLSAAIAAVNDAVLDGGAEPSEGQADGGYEPAGPWPDVRNVFFPEPYKIDFAWSEAAGDDSEAQAVDSAAEPETPPQSPDDDGEEESGSASARFSGEWETSLSEVEIAELESQTTLVELDDLEPDAAATQAEWPPDRDSSGEYRLDEADIEEIAAVAVEESRRPWRRRKTGAPPVPVDADLDEASLEATQEIESMASLTSTQQMERVKLSPQPAKKKPDRARVLPLARTAPLRVSSKPGAGPTDETTTEVREESTPAERDWFRSTFDGAYLESLPADIQRRTPNEVAFIDERLSLQKGARVLDVACGPGVHAVELAKRGYQVTGLDLSEAMLLRAQRAANEAGVDLGLMLGDMRAVDYDAAFDAAVVMGLSFGFFHDVANIDVLRRIRRALRPGGRLLLALLNRDRLITELPRVVWWKRSGRVYLDEAEFEFERSRVFAKRTIIYDDGRPPDERLLDVRLYSLHEVRALLAMAGFRVADISGSIHHPGFFFPMQSRELYVLSETA